MRIHSHPLSTGFAVRQAHVCVCACVRVCVSNNVLLCPPATSGDPVGLFTSFDLAEAGTLSFSIAPFRTGLFNVTVAAQDDGGTFNGGVDTAYVTFLLRILPEDKNPVFTVRYHMCIQSACEMRARKKELERAYLSDVISRMIAISRAFERLNLFAPNGTRTHARA